MNVGDILVAKTDNNIRGVPKYAKFIIYEKINRRSYIIKYEDRTMQINNNAISYYFWTASEYRKIIIEELI